MKRKMPVKTERTRVRRRKSEPVRLRTYTLMFVCGLLLVSGYWDLLTAMMRQWMVGFETVI